MRHDLLLAPALAIAARAPRMREASGAAGLVALASFAQRLAARRAGAAAAAIALAAIAAAAYQHLHAATRAGKCAGAARRVGLPGPLHARLAM